MAGENTVKALQIEITDKSKNLGKGLDTFIDKLEDLKKKLSSESWGGLTRLSQTMDRLWLSTQKAQMAVQNLSGLTRAIRSLGRVEINSTVAAQLESVVASAQAVTWDDVDRVAALARAMRDLNRQGGMRAAGIDTEWTNRDWEDWQKQDEDNAWKMYEKAAGAAGELQEVLVKAHGDSGELAESLVPVNKALQEAAGSATGVSENLKEAASAASAAGSTIRAALGRGATMALTGLRYGLRGITETLRVVGRGFTSIGNLAKKAMAPVSNLVRSIGRIAFYRMIRAAIKMVTEGFGEGISNIEAYSRLAGTELAPNLDSARNATLYLHNSLGALAAPIINVLAPALVSLIDKFVTLINLIGKFFAALSGAGVYTQARRDVTAYDNALKSAGGSAKRLKDYTMGIDELNVIRDPDSGGGGGGASAQDYSDMFEEVLLEGTPVKALADRIRQMVESGDWEGIGEFLGDQFNKLVSWVDGKHLGNLLGDKINHAVSMIGGFVRSADWAAAGATVANFINDLFSTIDEVELGRTITDTVAGALTFVTEWIGRTRWDDIGTKLANLINSIDLGKIAEKLGKAISDIVKGLIQFSLSLMDKLDVSAIGEAIGRLIRSIDWLDIAILILESLGQSILFALTSPFEIAVGTIKGLFSSSVEEELGHVVDITGTKAEEIQYNLSSIYSDYNDSLHDIEVNAALAGEYLDRLSELDELPELDTFQMEEYRDLVERLTGMYPDLTYEISEATGKLRDGADALREQVEHATELAKIEAAKGMMVEVQKVIIDAEVNNKELENAKTTVANSLNATIATKRRQLEDIGRRMGTASAIAQSDEAYKNGTAGQWLIEYYRLADEYEDVQRSIVDDTHAATEEIRDYNDQIKANNDSIAEANSKLKSLTDIVYGTSDSFKDLKGTTEDVADSANKVGLALDKITPKDLASRFEDGMFAVKNAFDDTVKYFSSKTLETKWKLNTNILIQVESLHAYGAQNVANALEQKFNQELGLTYRASGGLVESGEVFISRENGLTEFVGRFGNKTGVANNEQIIAGIASGVAMAVAPMIDSYNNGSDRIVNAVYANRTDVRIGDSDIANANGRAVANGGTQTSKGVFAFVR